MNGTQTMSRLRPVTTGIRANRFVAQLASHIILIGFVIVMVYPFLWMVLASLKSAPDFADNLWGLPKAITVENYTTAWQRANLGRAFVNSFIIASGTVLLVMAAGTLCAYALARFRLRGGLVLLLVFIVTMQAPVPIIPMYFLIAKLGLNNSYLGVILPTAASGLPLAIFIFWAFFRQLPGELMDAGVVDGCTKWGVFWRIVLPISGPPVATVAILQFLAAWNDFLLPLVVLRSPAMSTIPLAIQAFSYQFGRTDWQPVFAALSFGSIPMILLYLMLQRWFVQGLTAGAVKG